MTKRVAIGSADFFERKHSGLFLYSSLSDNGDANDTRNERAPWTGIQMFEVLIFYCHPRYT